MKKGQTITAKRDGQIVGTTQWDEPETVNEIVENFDDDDIVKCFIYGKRVKLQAEIRGPVKMTESEKELMKLFKKLTPEQRARKLAELKQ